MYPLEVRIDQAERELEAERQISMNLRDAIKALRMELLAEKDERAAMDEDILQMFPPLEEGIATLETQIITKAEKSSVELVRRALDVETELTATKFLEHNKRMDAQDKEIVLKISHREAK